MIHAGNVMAPDQELALHYAREFYGRRQESTRCGWCDGPISRELDDPDCSSRHSIGLQEARRLHHQHKLEAARHAQAPGRPRMSRRQSGSRQRTAADPDRRPWPRERAGRAAADRGRRRVRHRLLGLRVDRHRAHARGGRGHELDQPGRDRPCQGALRAPGRADRRRPGRDRVRTRSATRIGMPRCSNHPRTDWAFTVARRYLYETADAVRLEALGALIVSSRSPASRPRCGARSATT